MAASAASLTAQPADRTGRGERPEREALRKQALELFDKNKDGELDEEDQDMSFIGRNPQVLLDLMNA